MTELDNDPDEIGRTSDQAGAPAPTEDGTPERKSRRTWLILFLFAIAVAVLALDQSIKQLVIATLSGGKVVDVIGTFLQFRLVRNPGAAFSFAVNYTWVLAIIATVVVIVIIRISRKLGSVWWALALGLLLGGALGNLMDRYFREPGFARGHVIDFIAVPHFAVFNIADSAIFCAAVLIVILGLKGIGISGRVDRGSKTTASVDDVHGEAG